ncbi:hypothetical protein FHU41_001974 [Psychromicrobium silvestre]|uniref:Uncharacterized protein n=1 Tax=Psychromicrobium silvestre TaxID=1645614 RepID=A0A7Y9LU89_9MICC|nr:hypothetical protein [Psychromicrobium silvestre]NYE95724.1 hypothetical protein [Psychromicrobium silvestre]
MTENMTKTANLRGNLGDFAGDVGENWYVFEQWLERIPCSSSISEVQEDING